MKAEERLLTDSTYRGDCYEEANEKQFTHKLSRIALTLRCRNN